MDGSYFNLDWIRFSEIPVPLLPKASHNAPNGEYAVYNVMGSLIGMVHLSDGTSLQKQVEKVAGNKGIYLIKSKADGKMIRVNIDK